MRNPKTITAAGVTKTYAQWASAFGVTYASFRKSVQRHGEQGAVDAYAAKIDTRSAKYKRTQFALALLDDMQRRAETNPGIRAYLDQLSAKLNE
jgi:hypothetical protein